MSPLGDLDPLVAAVDRDGAIAETHARATASLSRGRLLTLAFMGALATADRARGASGGKLAPSDISLLNYALVLEYLQASFYTEAETRRALSGKTAAAARVIGAVERAHVEAFRRLLGSRAVKRPSFDFGAVTQVQRSFLKTAVAFEDLSVAAYKGAAPHLVSRPVLAAAVGIHSVEARHAAWMRELFGVKPASRAFDEPAARPTVERIVASTRFIVARPHMKTKRNPRYTG